MPWIMLTIGLAAYAGLCLFFFLYQRSFIYRPRSESGDHAAALTLAVPDAMLRISAQPHAGPQALVYFGGNAEDVVFTVAELAAVFPDRAIYALHYRGYCGSSVRPSERLLRNDARAVFSMVQARHADIMVVGRSLGSSLAVQLAAERSVSRLVLIAPFASILALARRIAPFLPMRLLLREKYESWRYAPQVTCPTLIVAASDDELVPMAETKRLLGGFPSGVARLRVIDGTDHNSVTDSAIFWDAVVRGS